MVVDTFWLVVGDGGCFSWRWVVVGGDGWWQVVALFSLTHYFNFERNYEVLKSPCILLNKNINLNKSETESKMENPRQSFRETNLVLQLI